MSNVNNPFNAPPPPAQGSSCLKGCAIGCGLILLVLAVVGGVVAWKAPELLTWIQNLLAQEQERQAAAENWNPPAADAPDADLFPEMIADYRRETIDDGAKIAELQIDLAGKHAVYRNRPSQIDVYVYPVTQLEREALLKRIEEVNEKGSGMKTWSKVDLGGNYARIFLQSENLKQNHLWFTHGRLVVFRTADTEDRENFVLAFFKSRQMKVIEPKDEKQPADEKPADAKAADEKPAKEKQP